MMIPMGKIIEPPKANIREHERRTAEALASAGYIVEFVVKSEISHTKSADVFVNGIKWEIKSPISSNIKQIEKNLKKGVKQSRYLIIDSQRVKSTSDITLEKFLRQQVKRVKSIKRILFINRQRKVFELY